ncbi:MAG: DUF2231 domain-containing protein [Bacteroidia bacterium]|nr:DUF2231 domain-containing protein [Bacteroidia bacterium]
MPFHPLSVHLPIGLLLATWGLYVWQVAKPDKPGLAEVSFYALLASEIALILAVITGRNAETDIIQTAQIHELVETHETAGYVLVWIMGLLTLWVYLRGHRWKKGELLTFFLTFTMACGLMAYGAHLGGKLVYEQGAGVMPMEELLKLQRQTEQLNILP